MKKVLDTILNRLGYYKFEMPSGSEVTEAEIMEIMGTLGENKLFTKFLRDLCAQDIRLYFQANNDRDRFTIRGAHDRSHYFLSLIKKSNEKAKRKRGT